MSMRLRFGTLVCLVTWVLLETSSSTSLWADDYAEIQVVDAATGRGVPLVELETVDGTLFVTDNAGRVAFGEPGLLGEEVYFSVRSHGYEVKKDGFGFAGARLKPEVGKVAKIEILRTNLAERLCRLTGEGLNRDSVLLGKSELQWRGKVAGQDSIQSVVYDGKVYWLWGDTSRISYPLGMFRMAGATTPLPDDDFDPAGDPSAGDLLAGELAVGIDYEYFVDPETKFVRPMMPLPERPEGVIWLDGLCVVPDADGKERMVCRYSRRKGLAEELEHGIGIFHDEKQIFEVAKTLPLEEKWRLPISHPVVFEEDGKKWLLFGSPNPNVRVEATLDAVLDPSRYEALTCLAEGSTTRNPQLELDDAGKPVWRWQKELPPVDSKQEAEWIKRGKLKAADARFCPRSIDGDDDNSREQVVLHNGTVRWNEYRQRWILLAGQIGGKSSFLGEVWYAEADHPTGPFRSAVRVVTHDKQTFYNVCHHAILDREGGRVIHFEGTYTNDFSGNPIKTPRYNYNQVMYRLELDAEELKAAREN